MSPENSSHRPQASSEAAPRAGSPGRHGGSWRYSRLAAGLVLIPTVPMLLLSVAALALFYVAPGRFGSLIARLPGDDLIRTVLVFAPATLFAVTVLALLYAIEKPEEAVTQPVRSMHRGAAAVHAAGRTPASRLARAVPWAELIVLAALTILVGASSVLVLSLVAPDRFAGLIARLPGTRFLRLAIPSVPLALIGVALFGIFLALARGGLGAGGVADARRDVEAGGVWRTDIQARLTRWVVLGVLISALPLLSLSLTSLGLSYLAPGIFGRVLARLPVEVILRLGLILAPTALLAVVLLAVLYLRSRPGRVAFDQAAPARFESLRQVLALGVLVGGLVSTSVVAVGLLGVLGYLLLA